MLQEEKQPVSVFVVLKHFYCPAPAQPSFAEAVLPDEFTPDLPFVFIHFPLAVNGNTIAPLLTFEPEIPCKAAFGIDKKRAGELLFGSKEILPHHLY
ncbi:MAG: hypothetical protein IKC77_03165 [Lentisphaeria bacterium]|nr:hypothetical protein [Lentisphaeria bacterium]